MIFALLAVLFVVILLWRYASFDSKEQAKKNSDTVTDSSVSSETSAFWDFFNKAEKARKNRSFEKAAALYEKAHALNPQHQGTLYYLGQMHLNLRYFKQARTYWHKLAQIDPTSVQAQKQLGTLYFCRVPQNPFYNLKKARTHYLNVLELNRIETYTHLQLGKIALLQDSLRKAATYLSTVINHDFMNYEALFLSGYVRFKQNHIESANMYLAKADSVFQNMNSVKMHGEGATEAGFKPMLANEQFCDAIGRTVDSLISRHLNEHDHESKHQKNRIVVYQVFDTEMKPLK